MFRKPTFDEDFEIRVDDVARVAELARAPRELGRRARRGPAPLASSSPTSDALLSPEIEYDSPACTRRSSRLRAEPFRR